MLTQTTVVAWGGLGHFFSEKAWFKYIQKELTMWRAGWRAAEKEGEDPRKRKRLIEKFWGQMRWVAPRTLAQRIQILLCSACFCSEKTFGGKWGSCYIPNVWPPWVTLKASCSTIRRASLNSSRFPLTTVHPSLGQAQAPARTVPRVQSLLLRCCSAGSSTGYRLEFAWFSLSSRRHTVDLGFTSAMTRGPVQPPPTGPCLPTSLPSTLWVLPGLPAWGRRA